MTLAEATHGRAETLLPCSDGSIAVATTRAVVHDLGNLIQIATSAINIVARSTHMPATHSAPLLQRAISCLEQAGALVRQNLGRDRPAGDTRCNIPACLADIRTLVAAMDEPGLRLQTDVPRNLPEVRCDPIGLRRAILNLVLNARDAMTDGGSVRISARTTAPDDGQIAVEIRVADDGTGMPPHVVARVFDPSFTTKTDGLGGIGLPMVERFVLTARGTLAIASEPGLGTTIILRLPAVATILPAPVEEFHS